MLVGSYIIKRQCSQVHMSNLCRGLVGCVRILALVQTNDSGVQLCTNLNRIPQAWRCIRDIRKSYHKNRFNKEFDLALPRNCSILRGNKRRRKCPRP